MMENAGWALAHQARTMLGGDPRGRRVVVLAGRGGNGGGGLVAARRLSTWGAEVRTVLAQPPEQMAEVPHHQLAALERLGAPVLGSQDADTVEPALQRAELVLDALIGYSLFGAPREPIAALIRVANIASAPILALDIPSCMNGDTGEAYEPTIRATTTLTLALPKVGLLWPAAGVWTGDLLLADISVPEVVYRRLGLNVGPLFARSEIVQLRITGGASSDEPETVRRAR